MRAHERVPVCCAADIFHTGANEPEHGFVTDLSEGGAFVQTKRPMRRGDRMFLRVALDTEEVTGVATEVTWVKKFEPISVDGKLPGVGVRFLDLAPQERNRIRLYLRDTQNSEEQPSLTPQSAEEHWFALPDDPWKSLARDEQALLDSSDLKVCEPKVIFHDTDVDEYDVAATDPPRAEIGSEILDSGPELAEPELGDAPLEEELLLSTPPRYVHRSPTMYFALGSLGLGIVAGALYGAFAPATPTGNLARRSAAPAATATRIDLTAATALPAAAALPAAEPTLPAVATSATGPSLGDDDEIPGVTRTAPTAEPSSDTAVAEAAEPAATETAPAATEPTPAPVAVATSIEPKNEAKAEPKPEPFVEPKIETKPGPKTEAKAEPKADQPALVASTGGKAAISVGKPKQLRHGWQIAVIGGAVATKKFALGSPARAVIDVPAARAIGLEGRELGAGPFERVRLGKQGDQVRLVLDLRGVVTPSQVKFAEKGGDLVIEIPAQALAHR